tara:strand:- start:2325 stop:2966 length:642 start_codon:yes stop_codon:yes gene_type:complete
MAFAERMESEPSGADGLQMYSFGFWQQGVAPGDWSREVIARNLDGEDFKDYRRASDPSYLRDTGPLLPDAKDAQPDEIVVETGSLVAGQASEETIAAVGRLVAAYGEDNIRGQVDADALVQPARPDLYQIELVDAVADASRRAGLEGSPMHAAMRGMDAARTAPEDSLGDIGLHRRETDRETEAAPAAADAASIRFDTASQPLIQSADDFLML